MSEETSAPVTPPPAAPAAPAPVVAAPVPAAPAVPTFDIAALKASVRSEIVADMTRAMGGNVDAPVDPGEAMRVSADALLEAKALTLASNLGLGANADAFADHLKAKGGAALAIDLRSKGFKDPAAAEAAARALLAAKSNFWIPPPAPPAAPQNGSVQVQANQPLPPAPPPPASPTHVPAQSAPLTIQNVFNRAASALRR